MLDLRGKPIAITGASSGIGHATAIACAAAGMPVAVAARRADRLEQLVAQITASGGRAIAVRVDVDKPADCQDLVDRTVEAFGSIYSVFANAGFGIHRPIHETSDADMRAIFETNFFGTLNTIRPAMPHILRAGAGHILVCSSCLAKVGMPFHGAYSATKACQDHIARAMRIELAAIPGARIFASSVHPIGTRTEFFSTAERHSTEGRDSFSAPDFLMQPPERVARAIVRQLRRGRSGEVWTSTPARLGFVFLNLAPRLGDRILAYATRRMVGKGK